MASASVFILSAVKNLKIDFKIAFKHHKSFWYFLAQKVTNEIIIQIASFHAMTYSSKSRNKKAPQKCGACKSNR
ncbi:MAG: hypothetical protein IPM95_05135 [Sphingobacteriales bacterium]|nr:hypothetical protein [Sphingobacteriales bacterium]